MNCTSSDILTSHKNSISDQAENPVFLKPVPYAEEELCMYRNELDVCVFGLEAPNESQSSFIVGLADRRSLCKISLSSAVKAP